MVSLRIEQNPEAVNWDDVARLFHLVGWKQRPPEVLRKVFTASTSRFGFSNDQLVAVARAVTDGCHYALIVDVIVHPDFQRRNIGKQMLNSLVAGLAQVVQINLLCDPNLAEFYEKHGFVLNQSKALTLVRK
jgi:aralkylamine N-acetyltransferase